MFKKLIFLFLLNVPAFAIVPVKLFKNITEQMAPGKEYLSPLTGEVYLKQGYIHNLRFWSNYTQAFTADGVRDYKHDIGHVMTMKLLITLFPSPAGTLSHESGLGAGSFGRHATVEHIGCMLLYAQKVREGAPKKDLDALRGEIRKRTSGAGHDISPDIFKGIEGAIKEEHHIDFGRYSWPITVPYPQHTVEGMLLTLFHMKFTTKDEIWELLDILSMERIPGALSSAELVREHMERLDFQRQELAKEMSSDTPNTKRISGLRKSIEKLESTPTPSISPVRSLYPMETLVIKNDKFGSPDEWTPADVEACMGMYNPTIPDYDLYFATQFEDLKGIKKLLPYKSTESVLEAGHCTAYDRTSGEFVVSMFNDCVDTALRHFSNLMLYDPVSGTFKTEMLANTDMNAFYSQQSPDRVQDGTQDLRSAWNNVVADLNKKSFMGDTSVLYVKNFGGAENELNSGFLNFIYTWRGILGDQFEVIPAPEVRAENLEVLKDWFFDHLKRLCAILNPSLKIEGLKIRDMRIDLQWGNLSKQDIFGILDVKVATSFDRRKFSFELHASRVHMSMKNIAYDEPADAKITALAPVVDTDAFLLHPERTIYTDFLGQEKINDAYKILDIIEKHPHMSPDFTGFLGALLSHGPMNDYNYLKKRDYVLSIQQANLILYCPLFDSTHEIFYPRAHFFCPPYVKQLVLDYDIGTIDLKDVSDLVEIIMKENFTTSAPLVVPPSVKKLHLCGNVPTVDFTNAPDLTELTIGTYKQDMLLVIPPTISKLSLTGEIQIPIDFSHAHSLTNILMRQASMKEFKCPNFITGINAPDYYRKSESATINGYFGVLDLSDTIFKNFSMAAGVSNYIDHLILPPTLESLSFYGKIGLVDLSRSVAIKKNRFSDMIRIDANDCEIKILILPPTIKKLTTSGGIYTLDLRLCMAFEQWDTRMAYSERIILRPDQELLSDFIMPEGFKEIIRLPLDAPFPDA
jgi:hypothetical protein